MKKPQFVYVLAVKMKKDLFKKFENMVSDRFGKQPELVSFATSYEYVSGFGSVVVTADTEIDLDIMTSVLTLLEMFDIKERYIYCNNNASSSTKPMHFFVKVVKVGNSLSHSIIDKVKGVLNLWIFDKSFREEFKNIGDEFVCVACYSHQQLPNGLVDRINNATREYLTLLSLNS